MHIRLDQIVCDINETCPIGCDCMSNPYHRYVSITCRDFEGTMLPETIPDLPNDDFWYHFDFQGTNLSNVSLMPYLRKVKEARLSNNSISEISFKALVALQSVTVLHLDHNQLRRLPQNITAIRLENVTDIKFGSNPWFCDCQALETKTWMLLNLKHIKDVNQITCYFSNETQHTPLIYVKDTLFCIHDSHLHVVAGSVAGPLIMLICVTVFIVVKIRKRSHANRLRLHMNYIDDADERKFDVFLSYASEDDDFIFDTLVPQLENNNYKVCFDRIHFIGGNTIVDNISQCIINSKRTLVFFSNLYKDSHYCMWEFKEALNTNMREGTTRLITIKDTDLDMTGLDDSVKAYFNRRTYIEREAVRFWENLLYSLPERPAGPQMFEIQED